MKDRKRSDNANQSSVKETDIDVEAVVSGGNQVNLSGDHVAHATQANLFRQSASNQMNLDVNLPQVTISSPSSPYLYPAATATGPGGEPIVLLSPGLPGTGTPLTPAFAPRPSSAAGSVMEGEGEGDDDDEFNLPGE